MTQADSRATYMWTPERQVVERKKN